MTKTLINEKVFDTPATQPKVLIEKHSGISDDDNDVLLPNEYSQHLENSIDDRLVLK